MLSPAVRLRHRGDGIRRWGARRRHSL